MRVAVVNETSAVDKHPFIMSALEGRGIEVVNAGMAQKGEEPELRYIHTGLISALLLAAHRVDRSRGAEHPRPVRARERLDPVVGVERDLAEAPLGNSDEQRPDGRIDDVVGDVEQPGGGCGVAEAAVNGGGVKRAQRGERRQSPRLGHAASVTPG